MEGLFKFICMLEGKLIGLIEKQQEIISNHTSLISSLLERIVAIEQKLKQNVPIRNISSNEEQRRQAFQDSLSSSMGQQGKNIKWGTDNNSSSEGSVGI